MVAVAELEAGMISARTKAALAQAKKRGVQLGGDRGGVASKRAHKAAGRSARTHQRRGPSPPASDPSHHHAPS
jgi:DNA invertase Pin-like site-specific DNA recombinase